MKNYFCQDPEILDFGGLGGRKSSIFEVWAAPVAPKNHPKRWGRRREGHSSDVELSWGL